jgi:hypothetical protein
MYGAASGVGSVGKQGATGQMLQPIDVQIGGVGLGTTEDTWQPGSGGVHVLCGCCLVVRASC